MLRVACFLRNCAVGVFWLPHRSDADKHLLWILILVFDEILSLQVNADDICHLHPAWVQSDGCRGHLHLRNVDGQPRTPAYKICV